MSNKRSRRAAVVTATVVGLVVLLTVPHLDGIGRGFGGRPRLPVSVCIDRLPVLSADFTLSGAQASMPASDSALIRRIMERFKLEVFVPATYDALIKVPVNRSWETPELLLLEKALSALPPLYLKHDRAPRQIVLVRRPTRDESGTGGGYAARGLHLQLPQDFESSRRMSGPDGTKYGTFGTQLIDTVVHEYTHPLVESDRQLLYDWAAWAGWKRGGSGEWLNDEPNYLLWDRDGHCDPNEELAVAAGRFSHSPRTLSPHYREFFLTHPAYAEWAVEVLARAGESRADVLVESRLTPDFQGAAVGDVVTATVRVTSLTPVALSDVAISVRLNGLELMPGSAWLRSTEPPARSNVSHRLPGDLVTSSLGPESTLIAEFRARIVSAIDGHAWAQGEVSWHGRIGDPENYMASIVVSGKAGSVLRP